MPWLSSNRRALLPCPRPDPANPPQCGTATAFSRTIPGDKLGGNPCERSACPCGGPLARHRSRPRSPGSARLRPLERHVEHLVDALDEGEPHLLEEALGEVLDVGLVQLRGDYVRHAGALRGERLLLQPTDRQHL